MRLDFVSSREAEFLKTDAAQCAPAFLPAGYINDAPSRIQAYRRLNEITSQEQLDELKKSWRDRFGPIPSAAENLLTVTEIKIAAVTRKVTAVEVREDKVMLTRGGDYILLGGKFPRVADPDPARRLQKLLLLIRSL